MASHGFREELRSLEVQTGNALASKYDLRISSMGGSTIFGVDLVTLSFDFKRSLTIDEARQIAVGSVELLLQNINSNKAIRPYLAEYPFPVSRIQLRFFSTIEPSNKSRDFLSIFTIMSRRKGEAPTIQYKVDAQGNMPEKVFEETYDDAVKNYESSNG